MACPGFQPERFGMLSGMGASVCFENVVKIYDGAGSTRALDQVTLDVAAGEFVAVVGPSGCGKSTLLHLAGGIDRPTSGRVLVDARDLAELDEESTPRYRRRSVGP